MTKQNLDITDMVGAYPFCDECSSADVTCDAWANWNIEDGAWELNQVFQDAFCQQCGGGARLEWKLDEAFRKERICALNDALRQGEVKHGSIVVTTGGQSLGDEYMPELFKLISEFDEFSEDNDPYGERDFGAVKVAGQKIFWKIDCYDRTLKWHSPDKANPDVTERILTLMLAGEY